MKTKKDTILMIFSIILYLAGAGIVEALILIESERTRRILGVAIDCINLLSNVLMGFYRNNNKVNELNINASQTNQSLNNILDQLNNNNTSINNFGSSLAINANLCSASSSPLNTPINENQNLPFVNIPEINNTVPIVPKTPRNSIFITGNLTEDQEDYLKSRNII